MENLTNEITERAANEVSYSSSTYTEKQLDLINYKLDLIMYEVEKQRHARMKFEELKEELTLIAKEGYKSVVLTLEEFSEQVSTEKVAKMIATLARNIDNITLSIERLEKVNAFVDELDPIVHDVFRESVHKLDALAQDGLFDLLDSFKNISAATLKSFSDEDIQKLNDSSEEIGRAIKNLADPNLFKTINVVVDTTKEFDFEQNKNISIFKLLKMLSSQSIRKVMVLMVNVMNKIFGNNNSNKKRLTCK